VVLAWLTTLSPGKRANLRSVMCPSKIFNEDGGWEIVSHKRPQQDK